MGRYDISGWTWTWLVGTLPRQLSSKNAGRFNTLKIETGPLYFFQIILSGPTKKKGAQIILQLEVTISEHSVWSRSQVRCDWHHHHPIVLLTSSQYFLATKTIENSLSSIDRLPCRDVSFLLGLSHSSPSSSSLRNRSRSLVYSFR